MAAGQISRLADAMQDCGAEEVAAAILDIFYDADIDLIVERIGIQRRLPVGWQEDGTDPEPEEGDA